MNLAAICRVGSPPSTRRSSLRALRKTLAASIAAYLALFTSPAFTLGFRDGHGLHVPSQQWSVS